MKKGFARALALLAALALSLTALPAFAAQPAQLAGAWYENGALGETVIYFSPEGNYLAWHSWQQMVESGTYAAAAATVTLTPFEGASTVWDYTLLGDFLSAFNRPTGAMLNMQRFELAAPEALLGYWEGTDEQFGPFDLQFMEDSTFDEFYYDDLTFYEGIFIANQSTIAMGYTDGYGWQNAYRITGEGQDAQLNLYNPQTGELRITLTRPLPEVSPDVQPTPVPTDVPLFTPGPLVTAVPFPTPQATLPAGLAGAWRGEGPDGAHVLVFGEDGAFSVTYDDPAMQGVQGNFLLRGDSLELALPDGGVEVFRFILMGDSLLLADAGLVNTVTYARTQVPVVTDMPPVTDIPVLPTDPSVLPTDAPPPAGGIDPALAGTWGGFSFGEYFELTIREDGTYDYLSLPDETLSHAGQVTADNGQLILTYPNGISQYAFYMENGVPVIGDENRLLRLSGPLSRLPLPDTAPAMTADPILTGVWGGLVNGSYEEHAFFADGTYQHFVFLPEPAVHPGNYMASNGSVAILTMDGARQVSFSVTGDILTLTMSGEEPVEFTRKPGTITRPAQ